MTKAARKTKVLTCRMKFSTIIGAYDVHELIGRTTVNLPMSSIVVAALDALIETMRAEGKLPAYNDDLSVLSRLQDLLGDTRIDTDDAVPDTPSTLEIQTTTAQQFEDTVEALAPTLSRDPIAASDVDVGELEAVTEATVAPSFSDLEQHFPTDELVLTCKGKPTQELALVEVYSNIPVEMYSTEIARRLLSATMEIFSRREELSQSKPHEENES